MFENTPGIMELFDVSGPGNIAPSLEIITWLLQKYCMSC